MASMDDIYQAHAKTVYRYLFTLTGQAQLSEELTAPDDLRYLYFGSLVLWGRGTSVSSAAWNFYNQRNAMASPSPVGSSGYSYPLPFASYRQELIGEEAPYTLSEQLLDETVTQTQVEQMEGYSYLLLALEPQLGQITWTYTDSSGQLVELTVDQGMAEAYFGTSLTKVYSGLTDEIAVQQLMDELNLAQ